MTRSPICLRHLHLIGYLIFIPVSVSKYVHNRGYLNSEYQNSSGGPIFVQMFCTSHSLSLSLFGRTENWNQIRSKYFLKLDVATDASLTSGLTSQIEKIIFFLYVISEKIFRFWTKSPSQQLAHACEPHARTSIAVKFCCSWDVCQN